MKASPSGDDATPTPKPKIGWYKVGQVLPKSTQPSKHQSISGGNKRLRK